MMKRFKNAWLVLTGRAVAVRRECPRDPKRFYSNHRKALSDIQPLQPYRLGL